MDDLIVASRLVIALWLGMTGILELRDRSGFRRAVRHYRILPRSLADLYAATVPFIEIAVAIISAIGIFVEIGGLVASLLLASFAIAICINILRGRNLDCHCFGNFIRARASWYTLTVDLLLIVPSAFLLSCIFYQHELEILNWPLTAGRLPVVGIMWGIGYALAVGVIYLLGFRLNLYSGSLSNDTIAASNRR